ncbi:MAG TPA: prepilin-type N-terminal cleavage/methylation domain-containing protein [Sedimentibacter sp.]|jgi:prepilin-type N-terminal cleavage/methylation domain-containing protein|nr:prepilin-type N-terminal cleavage/methylation domain-containing protein [Sedimentibacter sp.]HNZ83314.1 prepilin-type N-terminal cleavage/methylation domain-containing protein [Sedimentibacter sp.]HOH70072.1 prepilin-type N-terminal cleavage/methylation domain-containing protein [Sedimentibacter sp.]HPW99208.1 prepilin-type N-terminal cleavage/methylation domain-containing protein [Sedimentibacter sp.]HQB62869.1 prepilin-type N-terminal cleavage/methylation domain-containing protein [Sedimen
MKNKGFTMIELLVSLGISSIVIGLIMSFFVSTYKGYRTVRNDSEMDFQAQYILNFMTGRIVDSDSMSFARLNTQNYSMIAVRSSGAEYPVNTVSFKYGEDNNENYVFAIRNNIISYGKGEKDMSPTVELGNYVDGIYISLLRDESFQDARAVKIKIVMKKDGQTYEAFQTAYMRN